MEWHLRNDHGEGPAPIIIYFGQSSTGDKPIAGDWDGDGHDSIGIVRANGGGLEWHFKNSLSGGFADFTQNFGNATDKAVPGDWDGDGDDTLGVTRVNGNTIRWYLRNDFQTANPIERNFGQWSPTFDRPIAGDWNGDGTHTLGITRNLSDNTIQWHLKNDLSEGPAPIVYSYGLTSSLDKEVRGDWDNETPVC